ncbi:MAG: 2-oxoglutarate-dependent ethylene/succinate-forming enzyme [Alphaproteobacteria bacterium MarineAlpha11_Bin1]|nr:MAG: 2-oxoglutarate-dependent ethylene/succinate-forming enzyme [Alphaproteobacteria bacterium MarineAlpha11_Bin1]|tara:strand:- start:7668 stop:8639 length:972 start_codon:yes stop_codon:yes gene_type:complete
MTGLGAEYISEDVLPIIDITSLRSGDKWARNAVASEIRSACLDLGFMYIVGHGVDPELRAEVFAQSARFFAQPRDLKLVTDMKLSPHNRGYEPLGAQTLEDGARPDLKEGFYIGEEIPMDHPRLQNGSFNLGPNQWPEGLPGFEVTMMNYYVEMLSLGETLMRGIALSLALEENYFANFCREPLTALKLLHYPPQPANPDLSEKGCGAHTDFGGITMLMQDENGGLQVLGKNQKWLHAPPIQDAYVVNLADMISRWTNDMYRSTLHRVINLSGMDRYSVPFFFSGRPAHEVVALECCLADGEEPKYPPTTVEEHMREMYARTY